jgi:MYXO-CTERM domain-containing protein
MQNLGRNRNKWLKFSAQSAGLASAFVLTSLTAPAQADQFILFDATFDYSWEDANNSSPSKSHYYVNDDNFMNLERPDNWVSPTNYRDGSVHIRVEVLDKPAGDQSVGWALCYIANEGAYGCPYSQYYTAEGVFENDVSMADFWKSGPITWEAGIKQVDLVYTINSSGSGHVHNFPELASATTPTSVRITMVQVSQGDTYDSSILEDPAGTGGADAGTGGGPATGGAAATGGMDGVVGSGGATATGGAPATGGATGGAGTENPTGDGDEEGDDSEAAAGCSLNSGQNSGGSTPLLLIFAGLFGALRLRRRSSLRA